MVIGYSWQDATLPSAGAVGQGWSVAWRRFLLVLIGIAIAFVGAFLPPKSTQKTTIRRTYAATLDAGAAILFRVISLNVNKQQPMQRLPNSVIKNITATRARLLSSALARNMIKFEFDFRGKWRKPLFYLLRRKADHSTFSCCRIRSSRQLASRACGPDRPIWNSSRHA